MPGPPFAPDPTAERVAALEQQVADLTALLSPRYDRRALLRRGGAAVIAGAAGALALPSAATAAEGDPVLAGRPTDAGAAPTTLTGGTPDAPTLELTNPATTGSYAAPALRLTPSGDEGMDPERVASGDLASGGDLLWYGHVSAASGAGVVGAVYTSAFANHLQFLDAPRRVLDTRDGETTDGAGNPNDRRTRVVAGRFDAEGRLVGGSTLVLDLAELVLSGVGVLANLTVVGPTGNGHLTAYPTPDGTARTDGLDRPASSNLNFVRGVPALANFCVVRLGAGGRVSIYSTTTAHVLLDVSAVSVTEPFPLP